ncbi:MAG: hypothetical protein LC798_15665 [Chloroflexi bacterium]|nr:hypothetical protein [Chloroflexota bacterium]
MKWPRHRCRARAHLRDELLLHPYELPLAASAFIIAIVFTVLPDVLEHSPVGFETRGIIHHVWHYALLLGAALNLIGRFAKGAVALTLQGVGLALLLGCLLLNLSALVTAEIAGSAAEPLSGLSVALRVALIVGICVRLFIIAERPTVDVGAGRDG